MTGGALTAPSVIEGQRRRSVAVRKHKSVFARGVTPQERFVARAVASLHAEEEASDALLCGGLLRADSSQKITHRL